MRTLFLLALLCHSVGTFAQSPQVLTISPTNMAGGVSPSQNIVIQFDSPLDPSSVTSASVRVFGRWSGPAAGSFTMEDGDKRIIFSPIEPFFAGEMVTVSVNKKLRSALGPTLEKGHFWQYGIKTAPGSLKQNQVEVIPLRLPSETWIETYGAYAGDLNNDGHSDLVAVNEESDDLRVLLNDGTGHFPVTSAPIVMGTGSASPSEAADFNNDGEIDLVVTTAHHNETRVLYGDGLGDFPLIVKYTTGNGVRAVVVGDFDFDGDDDILTANRDDGTMNYHKNPGNVFFQVSTFNPAGNGESALALADANNDGIADFFLGFYNDQKIALYLGDGLGNFAFSSEMPVNGTPWMMCGGDFNGDGFADAASANSETDKTVVIFGDGQGGLSAAVTLMAADHDFPLAIDAGDLDGDGDIDLVTSSYSSNNYSVFENDGAGNFTQVDILPAVSNASCAVLHDRDGDGDLDITGTDETDDLLILFENPGSSVIQEPDARAAHFRLFPNPAKGAVFAEIELNASTTARFDIFDFSGKKIKSVQTGVLPAGSSKVLILNKINDVPMAYRVQMTLANGQTGGAILIR